MENKNINGYQEQADKFIKKHGLEFRAAHIDYAPYFPDDKESRNIYRLTLRRVRDCKLPFASTPGRHCAGQKTWFRFGTSLSATRSGKSPTAYDLLAVMIKSDPGSFEDFA